MRVTQPLRMMDANIGGREANLSEKMVKQKEEFPPITIKAGNLRGINYKLPVASAQVKSALLLAGLYAKGITKIFEPIKTRDHTERMLKSFGAAIEIKNRVISLQGGRQLNSPGIINIPGDISSASFFIVAAILLPRSRIIIKSVELNPTRIGVIRVLKRMGADIKIIPYKSPASCGEPVGDIIVRSSNLKGTEVKRNEVPLLIDELPILMVAACLAKGKTVIYGVEELRVKETDRIISLQSNLIKMGAQIHVRNCRVGNRKSEKIIIQGKKKLKGARVMSFNDHRTAMSMIVAGLVCKGSTLIDDIGCIAKSFPNFIKILKSVTI